MTPGTDAAFLAAIASNPDDGLVRLVYADWLDERGRAEADFLRTEHELTNVPPDQPRWHELFRRHQAVGHGLPAEWCNAVRRQPLDYWLRISARGAWRRLEKWCEQHHPQLLETLNPGATAEQIAEVEATIGQRLPADVRESFAIHNGDRSDNGFLLGVNLLPAEAVMRAWRRWREYEIYDEEYRGELDSWPVGAVQLDHSHSGWIPLTEDWSGNFLGVDLAPGPEGVVGQVINFGRDEEQKCVIASGWTTFLGDIALFLDSGMVTLTDTGLDGWTDSCRTALGDVHTHDGIRQWRKKGWWPVRPTE